MTKGNYLGMSDKELGRLRQLKLQEHRNLLNRVDDIMLQGLLNPPPNALTLDDLIRPYEPPDEDKFKDMQLDG